MGSREKQIPTLLFANVHMTQYPFWWPWTAKAKCHCYQQELLSCFIYCILASSFKFDYTLPILALGIHLTVVTGCHYLSQKEAAHNHRSPLSRCVAECWILMQSPAHQTATPPLHNYALRSCQWITTGEVTRYNPGIGQQLMEMSLIYCWEPEQSSCFRHTETGWP